MLRFESVTAGYGRAQVLHEISLHIRPGRTVALIGANGAGKTTALHTLSGLLRPTSGTITFAGQDITFRPAHEIAALGVVHCPEGRRVFARMTVEENLLLGSYLRRDKAAIAQDLRRMYEVFSGLASRRHQLAGTLSGGEQQMLAIGRASMARPKLLALDEPSLGLAPQVVRKVFGALHTLGSAEMTILLVEQNAAVALGVADDAYVMEGGRILLSGPAHALRDDERVRRAYLGQGIGSDKDLPVSPLS